MKTAIQIIREKHEAELQQLDAQAHTLHLRRVEVVMVLNTLTGVDQQQKAIDEQLAKEAELRARHNAPAGEG